MRAGLCLATIAALLVWAPVAARAGLDYPTEIDLPDWDWSIGISGGAAFGEGDADAGGLIGLDIGVLDGVLGLHAGLRVHGEGQSRRIGGLIEVTGWYVLLIGVGARFGWMVGDGGPGVERDAAGMAVLVAVPVPVWRSSEGRGGSLVVAPYARPGLRFASAEEVSGFHEVGVMLRWTSFAF